MVCLVRLLEREMQNKFICMQTVKYYVQEKTERWLRERIIPTGSPGLCTPAPLKHTHCLPDKETKKINRILFLLLSNLIMWHRQKPSRIEFTSTESVFK